MGIHYGNRPSGNSGIALDLAFPQNTLLLKTNEVNGAQNNTFVDGSTNNATITRVSTPTQGSFSPYGELWSNYFSGTAQFLAMSANTAFVLDGSFTVEAWVCLTAIPALDADSKARGCVLSYYQSGSSSGYQLGVNKTDNLIYFFKNQTGVGIACSYNIQIGTWYHIAVVYNGTTGTVYVNGVSQTTTTNNWGWVAPSTPTFRIAALTQTSYLQYFPGYISNLRIIKGTALYTSNFTPSITPLTVVSGTSLLTCQSYYFKDNSSNNFEPVISGTPSVQRFNPFFPQTEYTTTLYGGSGYFNGTSDCLTLNTSDALNISTGDFTAECWFNTSNSNTGIIFSLTNGSTITDYTQASLAFGVWSTGNFAANIFVGNTFTSVAVVSMSRLRNQWVHAALVRSGNTFTCYVNGILAGTYTGAVTLNYNSAWKWGVGSAAGSTAYGYHTGYISDLRITKGVALYTAAFTPTRSPLTTTANTSLLMNFTNAGVYDTTGNNNLVTVGDARVNIAVAKYGASSMYFDGTGDYLEIPSSDLLSFGTGDFTVEAWCYFNSLGGANYAPVFANSHLFYVDAAGRVLVWNGTNNIVLNPTGAVSTGTWTHIAWARSAGIIRSFVNGTQTGTDTSFTASVGSVSPNRVGRYTTVDLSAYIDELRITKGYARYIANFTPPTRAFPNRKVG